jgi:hypothetical protein
MIATGTVVPITTLDAVLAELRAMKFEEHALKAEIEELISQRNALLAAAQATIDTFEPDDPHNEPTYNTPRGDARAALRAAVVACEVK